MNFCIFHLYMCVCVCRLKNSISYTISTPSCLQNSGPAIPTIQHRQFLMDTQPHWDPRQWTGRHYSTVCRLVRIPSIQIYIYTHQPLAITLTSKPSSSPAGSLYGLALPLLNYITFEVNHPCDGVWAHSDTHDGAGWFLFRFIPVQSSQQTVSLLILISSHFPDPRSIGISYLFLYPILLPLVHKYPPFNLIVLLP